MCIITGTHVFVTKSAVVIVSQYTRQPARSNIPAAIKLCYWDYDCRLTKFEWESARAITKLGDGIKRRFKA